MPAKHPKRKVVLIHPPAVSKRYLRTKFMPHGMACIYAFLRNHGVPVEQHDCLMEYLFESPGDIDYHNPVKTFSDEEFFSFLRGEVRHHGLDAFSEKYVSRFITEAGIYAFSIVAYHQFWAALLLSRYIRRCDPDAVIIFGGPFITIKPVESVVQHGFADYWVKGSGEIPLLMLYRILCGQTDGSLDGVPGLVRTENGVRIENPKSHLPAASEPTPDFEGLCLDGYRYDHPLTGDHTFFLPYRISKGCPSRCSFCTGRLVDRYSVKPFEKVVSELIALSLRYGTNNFMFTDASINGSPRLLARICDELALKLPDIRWYAYGRVRGFDRELLFKARDAGCFALFWGVESAHQPTVELLGKPFLVERMYDVIDQAVDLGIKNYIHVMYNTPHETGADVKAFKRLVERYLGCRSVVFLPGRFLLEPHALMFDEPGAYGLTNVVKAQTSVFERDQYTYDETRTGLRSTQIRQRDEDHRRMLAHHLEWIGYQAMTRNSKSRLVRLLPSRLLAYTNKHARQSRLAARIHESVVHWVEAKASGLGEQM